MVFFCAYLVGMGYSKIAYIDYPQGLAQAGYDPAVFCGEGYQNALRKHGLPFISGGYDTTTKDAHRLLQKLLAEHPDLTALVTPNEAGLPGMYQAIWDAGKNIPTDFSVISLASPQRAERLMPTLSTINFFQSRKWAGS